MCDDEVKEDPREKIFPNWYDLSIKYEGYETKGTFGTFHVVNTHESQRPFVIKLLPSVAKPTEEDPFICESLDVQEDEDFEWVKGEINGSRYILGCQDMSTDIFECTKYILIVSNDLRA